MEFPKKYICASHEVGTLENPAKSPLFRRVFVVNEAETPSFIRITGLGFYRLFVNGTEITKGPLAPYISAPDQLVYFDDYEITSHILKGKNVIGVWLGNGIWNNPGGYIWDLDKANWRAAPQFAMRLEVGGDAPEIIECDSSFVTADSPITYDDYRFGEKYDARLEKEGWATADFDDSDWKPALEAKAPKGKSVMCTVDPIVTTEVIKPKSIIEYDGGYLYDFGKNGAGLCKLAIKGERGQQVVMQHGEFFKDGELKLKQEWFDDKKGFQRDEYICKGSGETETHMPLFTYHGFRYVHVTGITPQQATPELLTYNFMHSKLDFCGGFSCSDETVNALTAMVRRSDLSNFYYFPTDCPHREKHGWTGDAAFSSEHILQNMKADRYYREWLHQIRAAQHDDGLIPEIVPTPFDGWGYLASTGFDYVLIEISWMLWKYRSDKQVLVENADAIWKLIGYFVSHTDLNGFDDYGFGDWSPVGKLQDDYTADRAVTNTLISMDACRKAANIFRVLNQPVRADYADRISDWYRENLRRQKIDFSTMTVESDCQSAQAMALYYGLFEKDEEEKAVESLLRIIHRDGDVIDVGILGGRILFHTLSKYGYSELAYKMIVGPKSPCFGDWVKAGHTTMIEIFDCPEARYYSYNHHFWGDISSWFLRNLAGIQVNNGGDNIYNIDIKPSFVSALDRAEGWHEMPYGKISSKWARFSKDIVLSVEVPDECVGYIVLPKGYFFKDGSKEKPVLNGDYEIVNKDS